MLQPRILLEFDEKQQDVQKKHSESRAAFCVLASNMSKMSHVYHSLSLSLCLSVYRPLFLCCWVKIIKYESATSRTQTRLNGFSCHNSTRADEDDRFSVHSPRFWGRYLNIILCIYGEVRGDGARPLPTPGPVAPGRYVGYVEKWPCRTSGTGRPPPPPPPLLTQTRVGIPSLGRCRIRTHYCARVEWTKFV